LLCWRYIAPNWTPPSPTSRHVPLMDIIGSLKVAINQPFWKDLMGRLEGDE
jgi:hypothetical protein